MKTKPEIRQKAMHFLKNNNVMALATIGEDGKPQVAIVYYALDNEFNFYVSTRKKTRKFRNILKNPDVSFTIGTGPKVIAIQGGGEAEWSEEKANKFVWSLIENFDITKVSIRWPLRILPHKDVVVIKIKPNWMILLDLENDVPIEDYEVNFQRVL